MKLHRLRCLIAFPTVLAGILCGVCGSPNWLVAQDEPPTADVKGGEKIDVVSEEQTGDHAVQLIKHWSKWPLGRLPIRLSGWLFTGSCRQPSSAVSRDDVLKLFDQMKDLAKNARGPLTIEQLQSISDPLFPLMKVPDSLLPIGGWHHFETLDDGTGRVRYHTTAYHQSSTGDTVLDERTRVRDGVAEQSYSPTRRQADVYDTPTHLHMIRAEEILYRSSLVTPEKKLIHSINEQQQDVLSIHGKDGGVFILAYDASTGFVWNEILKINNAALTERIQDLPQITAEQIPIPRIIATLKYWHGQPNDESATRIVSMIVIDDWELNAATSEKDFKLAVPAGTVVVKSSEFPQPNKPSEQVLTSVDDVKSYASRPEFRQKTSGLHKPELDGKTGYWLMVANGLCLLVLAAVVFVTRRRLFHK